MKGSSSMMRILVSIRSILTPSGPILVHHREPESAARFADLAVHPFCAAAVRYQYLYREGPIDEPAAPIAAGRRRLTRHDPHLEHLFRAALRPLEVDLQR